MNEIAQDRNNIVRALRVDPQSGLVLAGGRYAEAAMAGRLFSIANQAAVATTAALATTWTGLGVCNPAGSGKNLIIHEFGWALTVIGSDEGGVGLMTADDTGMADALTSRSCKYGAGSSVAYCDNGATIGTPVLERIYGTYGTGAITTAMLYAPTVVELNGSIILPPDRSILTYTTTATTAAFVFHFLWEEVNI
jgi:hypothetical protein